MMSLWIRSKDKTFLLKVEDLFYADRTGEDEGHCIFSSGTNLGIYTSKERALEILDEIQDMILTEQIGIDSAGNECVIPMQLYEMPKE